PFALLRARVTGQGSRRHGQARIACSRPSPGRQHDNRRTGGLHHSISSASIRNSKPPAPASPSEAGAVVSELLAEEHPFVRHFAGTTDRWRPKTEKARRGRRCVGL